MQRLIEELNDQAPRDLRGGGGLRWFVRYEVRAVRVVSRGRRLRSRLD